MEWVGIVASAVAAIAGLIGIVKYWQWKQVGRTEAERDRLAREAALAKARGRIDSETRRLSPDDLTDELRRDARR